MEAQQIIKERMMIMKHHKIIYLTAFLLSLSFILLLEASPLGLLAEDINPLEKEEVEIELLLSASKKAGEETDETRDIQNQIEQSDPEEKTEEADKSSSEENKESREEITKKNTEPQKLIEEDENEKEKLEVKKEISQEQLSKTTKEINQEEIKKPKEEKIEKEIDEVENQNETKENKSEPPAWLKKPEAEVEENNVVKENNSEVKKEKEKSEKFDLESFIADLEEENRDNKKSVENGGSSNQNLENSRTEKNKKIKKNKSSEINEDKDKVYDLREKKVDGIKNPGIRNYSEPEYPSNLRKRNIESRVIVSLKIDKKGESHAIEIYKSSGYNSFDQAALEAVKDWKFEAAELEGEKVEVIVNIPIRFKLN